MLRSIRYTPGKSRRVISQARGMSVSRLHCTLGFDDPALLLLVGTQISEFFAASSTTERFLIPPNPAFSVQCCLCRESLAHQVREVCGHWATQRVSADIEPTVPTGARALPAEVRTLSHRHNLAPSAAALRALGFQVYPYPPSHF